MKRTARYLLALLSALMLVGVTACGGGTSANSTAPAHIWSTTAPLSNAAEATTIEPPVTTEMPSTAAPLTAEVPVTTAAPLTSTVAITTAEKPVATTTTVSVISQTPVTTEAPEATVPPAVVTPQDEADYLLNIKSMVFHTPDCGSGKNTKAENRRDFSGTWEELLTKGYSPCGNCDPMPALTTSPVTTKESVTTAEPQVEFDYILNTKTMKFHEPDCGSANNIKNENRAEFSGTRDELIALGYDPCGNCDP